MINYLKLFGLAALILICNQCADTDIIIPEDSPGIYGTVTDFATGEPVADATVQLRPGGETTLTGSDGMYEFRNLKKGNYSITVSKVEYTDLVDNYVIAVDTKMVRRDVQIEKLPAYFEVVDADLNRISSLDFGKDATSAQFMIFNNGPVALNCEIICSCAWVSSITEISNPINPGATYPIIVTIDRDELSAGVNTDYIHITSNNGSKQIIISAIDESNMPEVVTLGYDVEENRYVLEGDVIRVGTPKYYQKGFCVSTYYTEPTYDKCDELLIWEHGDTGNGNGWFGNFGCYYSPKGRDKRYFRAWLKYGNSQIVYGNVQSFNP
ncbi:MAG: carboxypeptidase regulatory-like domain-containing protein [Muribaculum sp.]|uniref:Carboxypeptidase regulatory-like domain-containing protein n=1 Tax=Candidatus Merdivivens faecigallinarum TaxID=2840871 RepID=A0A9D9NQU8_9BACT|nr:carboxypeptidase regulatory-like domain-containing protein [Candidatus Merdivivens faecigallinarum]